MGKVKDAFERLRTKFSRKAAPAPEDQHDRDLQNKAAMADDFLTVRLDLVERRVPQGQAHMPRDFHLRVFDHNQPVVLLRANSDTRPLSVIRDRLDPTDHRLCRPRSAARLDAQDRGQAGGGMGGTVQGEEVGGEEGA
ncbi:hypothetical protein JCM10296v2_006042 [Rhodotorula toruloides]